MRSRSFRSMCLLLEGDDLVWCQLPRIAALIEPWWQLGRLPNRSPGALRPRLTTSLPLHRGSGLCLASAVAVPHLCEMRFSWPNVLTVFGGYRAANTIHGVHLRRALLLFAIVLGMAALVAS